MSALVYKPGQGYWTRMMSAVAGGVLVAFGAVWAWGQLAQLDVQGEIIYFQGGAAGAILLLGGMLVYWLTYVRPKSGEFLIATEGEMRKVNWSSRREIMGSTWVVIAIAVLIAVVLFVVDILLSKFFQMINVLHSA
jgi:preprotein translocase subunit SecE